MRSNPFHRIICLSILTLFLSSCATSYKTVYVEVAKPTKDLLPKDIVSLTLMNRSLSDEFRDFHADSLQKYFYERRFDVEGAVLDSIAADTTLKVLAELLFESGRYDVVIPEKRNIPRAESYYRILPPLDWDYVTEICETYNTDALLVLERYMNKIMTDYIQIPYSDLYEATIDSKYDAIIKIYDPAKREIIKQVMVDDTIFWSQAEYTPGNLFRQLVPVKQALIETGIQVALEVDSKLSPQWQTESRGYFALKEANSDLLESSIRENNWLAAYNHWKALLDATNSISSQSKLEYNLAVASEMLGNFNQAAEWAQKSYKTQYRKQTESYLYQLKKRKQLIDQFKEYNND